MAKSEICWKCGLKSNPVDLRESILPGKFIHRKSSVCESVFETYTDLYQKGFDDGYIEGNVEGREDGYLEGHNEGYRKGRENDVFGKKQ